MLLDLKDHQIEVVDQLGNGKILYGPLGSGKSAVALEYYVRKQSPRHIYVITTGKKRDGLEWELEAARHGIGAYEHETLHGILTVDSWNKIGNYVDVEDAFFIFDEQRVVGHGSWVKSFLKIAKHNQWIMLTATPGDNWLDYAAVFIANGFYKNITQFRREHVVYDPWVKFPKVKMYVKENRLQMLRNDLLVEMKYPNEIERYYNWTDVGYNKDLFDMVYKRRWNPYEARPCKDAAELFRVLRRVVNGSRSRLRQLQWLMQAHPRLIVFYNFNYELEILRTLRDDIWVMEWNGHKKDVLPEGDRWLYLVQYVSGAEGWNCTTTNAMVLYSLTYSYKNLTQAYGRIDRLNTPYKSLYYYPFVSNSIVDRAIRRSLKEKRNFNEHRFMVEFEKFMDVDVTELNNCSF